jgi:transposase
MYISAGNKGVKKKNSQENPPWRRGLKLRGRGTYVKDKPPIISIVSRTTGQVIFRVAHNLSKKLIHTLISENCDEPVRVFTDDYTIYSNLSSHKLVKDING